MVLGHTKRQAIDGGSVYCLVSEVEACVYLAFTRPLGANRELRCAPQLAGAVGVQAWPSRPIIGTVGFQVTDGTTPLRQLLNRSGLPFQLAVEAEIRRLSDACGLDEVWREVPYAGGFIDVVGRMGTNYFAFECKRADEKPWLFICDPNWTNLTRCRLEWFNGRAEEPTVWTSDFHRVFCAEWSMVEASPESGFCVVPKGTPVQSLEHLCRDVLAGAHELMADEQLQRGDFAVAIPVIVTTAALHTCVLQPYDVSLKTGELDPKHGTFESTDLVRFRKSLVAERSNSYDSSLMDLRKWSGDRERTVFVMNPSALQRFFEGFRSFQVYDGVGGAPREFVHPPRLE